MIGFGANKGIIPNVCEELFQAIENRDKNQEYQVYIILESLLQGKKNLFSFWKFLASSGSYQHIYFRIMLIFHTKILISLQNQIKC